MECYVNKFCDFLESIKAVNPIFVEAVQNAYNLLHEGVATEEALDEADIKLNQNTEEKLNEDAPLVNELESDEIEEAENMEASAVNAILDELL